MPSAPDSDLSKPDPEELATLNRSWDAGEFAHHVETLLGFVAEKRDTLRRIAQSSEGPEGCIAAVRAVLIELGTVHPASEMRDQMKAIHDEIWYRGEHGENDREQIVENWTKRYAASWRRWRLKEYLFVLEKEARNVVRIVCPHAEED